MRRNKTENRLAKKPSKRDIELSESELKTSAENHRLNSRPNEIQEERYVKLDVTYLGITESSNRIIQWIKSFN